ncbi:phospholipase D family protein [Brevundimonas aurantiaca]|uniref:phospholipase D family protein n=1 Tax=Brevundimonas aurantiaca TaxID=74316 RepID=UPI001CD78E41|nr:phospholipase D family protein [Brevundimonas aurantiaca]
MELLNQPFTGQLGNRLIGLLGSGKYHTLNILVAFAQTSGVLRIKAAIEQFRSLGGKVNVIVGVDLGGTSYEALTSLLINTDSLAVVHSENRQTFHPKIYHLEGDKEDLLIVGSNNLTGGGLWTNFESSLIVQIYDSKESSDALNSQLRDYQKILSGLKDSFLNINDQGDIDTLLQSGYLLKEVDAQVRLANASKKSGGSKRLFGSGVPAPIPQLSVPLSKGTVSSKPAIASPSTPTALPETLLDWQTIWFETRSMTGGSRNILDLSARSLVSRGDPAGTPFDLGDPKFMRGSVAFFGLDPSVTSHTKDIVLNFEGVDYEGNTILFPSGARANGTWRLQIKGKSAAGHKITDAFRLKGPGFYLINKIVAFTTIDDSYYLLSVFSDTELSRFEAASKILGNNGITPNAKRVGIL